MSYTHCVITSNMDLHMEHVALCPHVFTNTMTQRLTWTYTWSTLLYALMSLQTLWHNVLHGLTHGARCSMLSCLYKHYDTTSYMDLHMEHVALCLCPHVFTNTMTQRLTWTYTWSTLLYALMSLQTLWHNVLHGLTHGARSSMPSCLYKHYDTTSYMDLHMEHVALCPHVFTNTLTQRLTWTYTWSTLLYALMSLQTLWHNVLHGLTHGARCSMLSCLYLQTLWHNVLHGLAHGARSSMHTSMAYSIRFVYSWKPGDWNGHGNLCALHGLSTTKLNPTRRM